MLCSSKKVFFEDYTFYVHEKVYEPAEDSFLFAENLADDLGDCVLDMGVGCGILAILSVAKANKIVAVDINPYAIRCAKENANISGVQGQIFFVEGNLFDPFKANEKFDTILFNAPYLPSSISEGKTWLEHAWIGGVRGRRVIDPFICDAPPHLKSDGRILLLQSSLSDINKTLRKFEDKKLIPTIIARKALPFFEEIVLIQGKWHDI